jgi:hypothetical protein
MYDEWLFSGPVEKTKGGNRRAPSKSLILKWIKQSWDAISPDIVRKSFKKCGISSGNNTQIRVVFHSDRLLDGWSYMCPKGIPNEKTAFLVI